MDQKINLKIIVPDIFGQNIILNSFNQLVVLPGITMFLLVSAIQVVIHWILVLRMQYLLRVSLYVLALTVPYSPIALVMTITICLCMMYFWYHCNLQVLFAMISLYYLAIICTSFNNISLGMVILISILMINYGYNWNLHNNTAMICLNLFGINFLNSLLPYSFEDIPISTPILPVQMWRWYIFLASGIITVMMLIVRWYWGLPFNKIMDEIGNASDHLKPIVKYRGTKLKDTVKDFAKSRDLGQVNAVYVNGWIPLIESVKVIKGKTIPAIAVGNSYCVFRGDDGCARVIYAYCPHLGANLAAGGRVKGNSIECPFHGWEFCGKTGKCTNIPYAEKVPDNMKLEPLESREVNGTIFVWHHAEDEPPSWEIPWIPQIQSGEWVYRGRSELIVNCHIQDIPENGADINHLPHVHSRFIAFGPRLASGIGDWVSHDWKPQWEPDKERPHVAKARIKEQVVINENSWYVPFTDVDVDIEQIGPAAVHLHMQTRFGKGVMLQYITTEEPLKQRIIHTFYTEPKFSHAPASLLMWGETIQIQRDIAVWNNKKFLKNPLLVKEDKKIAQFRRWYAQFYSENSPTLQDARNRSLEF